jgi:hypothetical protein
MKRAVLYARLSANAQQKEGTVESHTADRVGYSAAAGKEASS